MDDKHNLAVDLSKVLYAFASAKPDEQVKMDGKEMSEKNKKLAQILNIEIVN